MSKGYFLCHTERSEVSHEIPHTRFGMTKQRFVIGELCSRWSREAYIKYATRVAKSKASQ